MTKAHFMILSNTRRTFTPRTAKMLTISDERCSCSWQNTNRLAVTIACKGMTHIWLALTLYPSRNEQLNHLMFLAGDYLKQGVLINPPCISCSQKKNEARTKKDSWWVGRRGVEGLNEWADRSFWNLVPKSSSPLICRIHIQREYIVRLVRNPIISEELFSFSRGVRTEVSAVRVQLFCRAFVW